MGLGYGKHPRVGLFRYIWSDSSVPVHFVAPHGDYYVVDLSVYIGLTLLLSMAELGTECAVELRSGPATEIGGCLIAELGAAL
jgi:hypothetical protein